MTGVRIRSGISAPPLTSIQNDHSASIAELAAFLRTADNYTQDSREWPDPTAPRPSAKPVQHGCTCEAGEKLECPVHGMHATEPDYDNTWAQPQGSPIGYPQDQPRNWTQASVHALVVSNRSSEVAERPSHFSDVVSSFVLLRSLKQTGEFHGDAKVASECVDQGFVSLGRVEVHLAIPFPQVVEQYYQEQRHEGAKHRFEVEARSRNRRLEQHEGQPPASGAFDWSHSYAKQDDGHGQHYASKDGEARAYEWGQPQRVGSGDSQGQAESRHVWALTLARSEPIGWGQSGSHLAKQPRDIAQRDASGAQSDTHAPDWPTNGRGIRQVECHTGPTEGVPNGVHVGNEFVAKVHDSTIAWGATLDSLQSQEHVGSEKRSVHDLDKITIAPAPLSGASIPPFQTPNVHSNSEEPSGHTIEQHLEEAQHRAQAIMAASKRVLSW